MRSFAKRLPVSAGALALGCAMLPGQGLAQSPSVSQPVVQSLPTTSMGVTLNQALARLGQNPRDVDALIDAGNAALEMGDVDAAVGFYRRADQIVPGNGRVKAGLAGALVHGENPFDAIPLFDEAERAGATDGGLSGERGLAYDLVGDNEKAQRYYRQALASGEDDEISRRLSLSYAIAGDRKGSETALNPLLIRQDKAAWRTRAFALAILGQVDEAVLIANRTLPPALSAGIAPYLRYMPRLTAAQQAAAANLGHFPRASEIGRDDPRVALFAPTVPPKRPAQLATAATAATARSQPQTRAEKKRAERRVASASTVADRAPGSILRTTTVQTTRSSSARKPQVAQNTVTAPVTAAASLPAALAATTQAPAAPKRTRSRLAMNDGPAFTQGYTRSRRSSPATKVTATPAPTPAAVAPKPAIVLSETQLAAATPAPAPVSAVPGASASAASELPALASAAPSSSAAPAAAPSVLDGMGPTPAPASTPSTAAIVPPSTASLAQTAPAPISGAVAGPIAAPITAPIAPPMTTPAAIAEAPPKPATLAEAFKEFLQQPPAVDIAPAAGAVDIRRLVPSRQAEARPVPITVNGRLAAKTAKPVKAAPVKPPPPSHPSRIWVQLATGRNKTALSYDWRRISREAPQLFRGKQAFLSAWNATNRLLAGPFPSEAAATAFMAQLRRADVDGSFLWTSPAGQVVDPIGK